MKQHYHRIPSRPNLKSGCIFTVGFIGLCILFCIYIVSSFVIRGNWISILGTMVFLMDFAATEIFYVRTICRRRSEQMQIDIMQGRPRAVILYANMWFCPLVVWFIWMMNCKVMSCVKLPYLIGSIAIGLIPSVITFCIVLRNRAQMRIILLSIFRIILYETIAYTGVILHIILLV